MIVYNDQINPCSALLFSPKRRAADRNCAALVQWNGGTVTDRPTDLLSADLGRHVLGHNGLSSSVRLSNCPTNFLVEAALGTIKGR